MITKNEKKYFGYFFKKEVDWLNLLVNVQKKDFIKHFLKGDIEVNLITRKV